jgi:hypothetical protein
MLTYAHVCSRMLTYAHVCSRMLTYASFYYEVHKATRNMQMPLVLMQVVPVQSVVKSVKRSAKHRRPLTINSAIEVLLFFLFILFIFFLWCVAVLSRFRLCSCASCSACAPCALSLPLVNALSTLCLSFVLYLTQYHVLMSVLFLVLSASRPCFT